MHLTPLEYRVLECLARQAGMIVTNAQLLREVWGPDRDADDSRAARLHEESARQARAGSARARSYLVTETGVGYRLQPRDADEA